MRTLFDPFVNPDEIVNWDYLRELNDITGPDIESKRRAQVESCKQTIIYLEEQKANSDPDSIRIISAKLALVRQELVTCGRASEDPELIRAIADESIRNAQDSGYHPVIYRCYARLGNCLDSTDMLLMAFTYAHACGQESPACHRRILMWLASIWYKDPSKMPYARLAAQWARLIVPHDVESWFFEYILLARNGMTVEIESTIAAGPGGSLGSIAAFAAALYAAGRKIDAIIALNDGVTKAESEGADAFAESFRSLAQRFESGKEFPGTWSKKLAG